jgi:hypothetical protein
VESVVGPKVWVVPGMATEPLTVSTSACAAPMLPMAIREATRIAKFLFIYYLFAQLKQSPSLIASFTPGKLTD